MLPINRITSTISELIANRILDLDCEAHGKLKQFENKSIHISISDLGLDYFVRFPNSTVVVSEKQTEKPSASISGKSSAFIAAALNDRSGDAVFTGELHFSGDIGLAQRFQAFIESLQIDWQRPLSEVFGDEISYSISQGINKLSGLFQNAWKQTILDIPEYLQEESRSTPCRAELDDFYHQVDLIRSQAERLEARFKRLRSKAEA